MWSVLPGTSALTATRVTDVRRVVRTGFVNVHTLQGGWWTLTPLCHKHQQMLHGSMLCSVAAVPSPRDSLPHWRRAHMSERGGSHALPSLQAM